MLCQGKRLNKRNTVSISKSMKGPSTYGLKKMEREIELALMGFTIFITEISWKNCHWTITKWQENIWNVY